MILKEADTKDPQLAELESYLTAPGLPATTKQHIERELKFLRAGIKGERESAYDIDFYSGASKNRIVIHDLRIEHNGRVAQIDHLILNRLLEVYVLETKHFSEGVSINEQGEFSIWFAGKPRGIPSPLEQNERHIAVLQDVFRTLDMPTRLGIRLQPSFESVVLVSKNARIGRPEKFDTRRVVKSDHLERWINKNVDSGSPLLMAKLVGVDTLTAIARQLVALHRPLVPDYRARFGITEAILHPTPTPTPSASTPLPDAAEAPAPLAAPEAENPGAETTGDPSSGTARLTTSKLAKALGLKTAELTERLIACDLLELRDGKTYITAAGKAAGGEFRMSPKFGPYFLWPADLAV
jgi:hypothetical protein